MLPHVSLLSAGDRLVKFEVPPRGFIAKGLEADSSAFGPSLFGRFYNRVCLLRLWVGFVTQ
jgi:hypothetical protein